MREEKKRKRQQPGKAPGKQEGNPPPFTGRWAFPMFEKKGFNVSTRAGMQEEDKNRIIDLASKAWLQQEELKVRADVIHELQERPKRVAKQPRRNPFLDLILSIVAEEPGIAALEVEKKLKALVADPQSIIKSYDENAGKLEWSETKKSRLHVEKLSGIKNRVSRARDKVSKK